MMQTATTNEVFRKMVDRLLRSGPKSVTRRWAYRTDNVFDGLRITYDRFTDIGRNLYLSGTFEAAELTHFGNRVASLDKPVIVDIGANIGLHSIYWARGNPGASVYAFEPAPGTSKILRENIALNGLANIEICPYAMSDKAGRATFYECIDNAYSSLKDTHRVAVAGTYDVEVLTLDDFVAARGMTRVDLVKIDVEGFETQVLKGAQETIRQFHPDLFVEIFAGVNSNEDPQATIALLQSHGYKGYVFQHGVPVPVVKHDDRFQNYLFTTRAV